MNSKDKNLPVLSAVVVILSATMLIANCLFVAPNGFGVRGAIVLNFMFALSGVLIWRLALKSRDVEEHFRGLIDESPGILWLTNPQGECLYLSKKWFELTGQDPAKSFPFGWLDAIHQEDRLRVEKTFVQANETKSQFTAEYRVKTKQGEYRWVHDSGHRRFSPSGEYLGFIGTVVDVHERMEAEQDLQRAIRARDQFLSLASHELKTPLTALKLQVQIRQRLWDRGDHDTFAIEKIPDLLKADTRQIDRLAFLIDDLLDISRVTTGRFDMHRELCDLTELVNQVAKRLTPQLSAAHCELRLDAATGIVGDFDKERIQQVLLSLIVNATRFGEGRPIDVRVRQGEETAVVEVQDHGKGIAKEDHEKIFEKFERSLSSREIGGLGLGLFVAREIAHAHEGTLIVESELGSGSTFRLTLPLGTQTASPEFNLPSPTDGQAERVTGQNMRAKGGTI